MTKNQEKNGKNEKDAYDILRSTFADLQDLELRLLIEGRRDVQIGKFVIRLGEALRLLNPNKELPSPYAEEEEELILE